MSCLGKCPICKKSPIEPVNLKCEHHPCYNCIQSYLAVESQSKIQTKYKINCPACSKKTVLYDLRHLILTKIHQDQQELFVTDKFISQKPEVKVGCNSHRLQNNFLSGENMSHNMTRRGSIQSIANNNKMMVEVKCMQHAQPYKYFCCDCGDHYERSFLLCAECAKPHYNGGHKLLTLRQAQSKILNLNIKFKEQIVVKTEEVNYLVDLLNQNKSTIDQYYCNIQQNLNAEFKTIFAVIQNKYNTLRGQLKNKYQQSIRDIDAKIDKLNNQENILQSLKAIQFKDLQTNLKFYQTYQKFTISNQLNPVKTDIDFNELPQIYRKIDDFQRLADDWIGIKINEVSKQMSHDKKSRKQSNVSNIQDLSSRSHKQNRKQTMSPTDQKFNLRKMLS